MSFNLSQRPPFIELAKVIISHNHEFVGALCSYWLLTLVRTRLTLHLIGPEIWNVDAGILTQQGKVSTIDDAFLDIRSPKGSGSNTPARSRLQSPALSAASTPAGSGAEDGSSPAGSIRKKKKPTRNMLKAQEERRRLVCPFHKGPASFLTLLL